MQMKRLHRKIIYWLYSARFRSNEEPPAGVAEAGTSARLNKKRKL